MVPDFKAAVMSLMKFSPSSGPAYFYGYLSSKMTPVNTEESKMSPLSIDTSSLKTSPQVDSMMMSIDTSSKPLENAFSEAMSVFPFVPIFFVDPSVAWL